LHRTTATYDAEMKDGAAEMKDGTTLRALRAGGLRHALFSARLLAPKYKSERLFLKSCFTLSKPQITVNQRDH
jgi:hypothetical protein